MVEGVVAAATILWPHITACIELAFENVSSLIKGIGIERCHAVHSRFTG